jgi:hypothetical protein
MLYFNWMFLLTNKHHRAESFSGNSQLLSHSKISQYFVELEGLLPCSQEPVTGLCQGVDGPSPVKITLWLTISQSVCLGVEPTLGLVTRYYFLSEGCCLSCCPLWREDGSAVCSAITQWSESRRTHNHTLLSHLRLPQPGGPDSHIYISQEQGGPVIPPATGFSLRRVYSQGYGGGILTRLHTGYLVYPVCAVELTQWS